MKTLFNSIFCISAGLSLLIFSCNPDSDEPTIRYGSGVTDADGNEYLTVIIGNQEWMAENLKTKKLNDGTEIPLITSDTTWASLTSPGYCLYDNDESNKQIYGALYNSYTIETGKLSPIGWRLPTVDDWETLIEFLGGKNKAGGKLKSDSGWYCNGNGTNHYGFSALPAGERMSIGYFGHIGEYGYWWTSSHNENSELLYYWITCDNGITGGDIGYNTSGLSIRCIKNN